MLDDETVPRLRCPVIAGAANNQLAEDAIADLLQARGILWAPDFVANAGGIVNISVELEPAGYDPRRARERVRRIGATLAEVYANARAIGATPLTAAMELARRRLIVARQPGGATRSARARPSAGRAPRRAARPAPSR